MNIFKALICILFVIWLAACGGKPAEQSIEVDGTVYIGNSDYTILETPIVLKGVLRANVIEIFWYGCPHCKDFEPGLQEWIKTIPEGLLFARSPAIWSEPMVIHAKAYYLWIHFKLGQEAHEELFTHIISLRNSKDIDVHKQSIARLFVRYGVDKDVFNQAFDSEKTQQATALYYGIMQQAGIKSTPSFLINGRYLLSSNAFKSEEEMLKVAHHLVTLERDNQLVDWW